MLIRTELRNGQPRFRCSLDCTLRCVKQEEGVAEEVFYGLTWIFQVRQDLEKPVSKFVTRVRIEMTALLGRRNSDE